MLDLFSFDVDKDKNTRINFEQAFDRYESQMRANTESMLLAHSEGSSDIAREVFNLFVAKLVNFMRNPFFGDAGGKHFRAVSGVSVVRVFGTGCGVK